MKSLFLLSYPKTGGDTFAIKAVTPDARGGCNENVSNFITPCILDSVNKPLFDINSRSITVFKIVFFNEQCERIQTTFAG